MNPSRTWLFFVAILAASSPVPAPDHMARVIEAELSELDTSAIQSFLQSLDAEIRPFLPEFKPTAVPGEGQNPTAWFRRLASGLTRELALHAHLLAQLALLVVTCCLLTHLGRSLSSQNISHLAFYVCYLVMAGLSARSFLATIQLTKEAIGNMVGFMYALLPTVCSLLAAAGATATSALFHPLLIGAVTTVGHLVQGIVLPLAVLAAVVTLVGHLAEGFSLAKLANLLREATVGLTGLIMAGFIGVMSVRGVASAAADGVGLRTAKYVTGTFLPGPGKGISDAVETVAGCSLVLKNTIGGFGALSLLGLTIFPLLKIIALVVIYRLTAALLQPLGDNRMVDALNAIGGCFTILFGVVSLIGLAFFLGLTILVALGNLAYALR